MRSSLTCVSGRRPELTSSLERLERFYDGVRSASSGGSGGSEVVLRCKPHDLAGTWGAFFRECQQ